MILIFPLWIFHLHLYVEKIPATSAYGMDISQTIATTSKLTIYGLIQPTIEPKIYRTEMTTLTITSRMPIIFIFYCSLYLNIHRRRSRPSNQSRPASTDAPIEVTTSTYIVFTNDLQIVYNNKITGLKIIIIISFITCLFYTDLCLFGKV
jgi:hypothetical protein